MKNPDREKKLLERVYKAMAPLYFKEHMNMVPFFSEKVPIDKSLAKDIANYIEGKSPEYFHLIKNKQ